MFVTDKYKNGGLFSEYLREESYPRKQKSHRSLANLERTMYANGFSWRIRAPLDKGCCLLIAALALILEGGKIGS